MLEGHCRWGARPQISSQICREEDGLADRGVAVGKFRFAGFVPVPRGLTRFVESSDAKRSFAKVRLAEQMRGQLACQSSLFSIM